MRTRRIHLINPHQLVHDPPAVHESGALLPDRGLLAVAATIPTDQYEVVLTDENIEPIDFDLKADLVGISAMTSYVKRGYEIADAFRVRGIPVIMGGVHELHGRRGARACRCGGRGRGRTGHAAGAGRPRAGPAARHLQVRQAASMVDMPMLRADLVKKHRYVNRTFIQTSRGCHGCTFCSEPLMNGLRFRYRPVDEVIREVESCGQRYVSLNDADFFGTPERPKEVMRALKGRGVRWQAGVTSKLALKDDMLELAAESGCYMLSIGFESIHRQTLTSVHKHVNRPDTFQELVAKIHSYGILVFGLFIFGFDSDEPAVFEETVKFNIDADYDMCAYSVLTPYPGTLIWYQMGKANSIVSYDWDKYDQAQIVYRPERHDRRALREPHAYREFFSLPSMARRFPRADRAAARSGASTICFTARAR